MKNNLMNFLVCIVLAGSLMTGCSGKKEVGANGEEMTPIRISAIMTISWAPVFVADMEGFFAEEGLTVEFVSPGGPRGFQATHAGECEFCMLSQEPLLIAQDKGMRSSIIGTMLNSRVYGIIADPSVSSVADLKGEAIYGSDPGSAPYTFTCGILEEAGLDPMKDVSFMQMNLDAAITALENGEIKAAFINMSKVPELKDINVNVLVDTTREDDRVKYLGTAGFPAEMICATEKYVQDNPETCQKFMNAVIKGQQWIQEHSDDEVAEDLVRDFTALDKEILAEEVATMRNVFKTDCFISQEGQASVVSMCLNNGLISRVIPYDEIVNMTFVKNYVN